MDSAPNTTGDDDGMGVQIQFFIDFDRSPKQNKTFQNTMRMADVLKETVPQFMANPRLLYVDGRSGVINVRREPLVKLLVFPDAKDNRDMWNEVQTEKYGTDIIVMRGKFAEKGEKGGAKEEVRWSSS